MRTELAKIDVVGLGIVLLPALHLAVKYYLKGKLKNMDIVKGSSGQLAYDVKLEAGKLVAVAGDATLGLSVNVSVDAKVILELIKAKLPAGITKEIGDLVIAAAESALGA